MDSNDDYISCFEEVQSEVHWTFRDWNEECGERTRESTPTRRKSHSRNELSWSRVSRDTSSSISGHGVRFNRERSLRLVERGRFGPITGYWTHAHEKRPTDLYFLPCWCGACKMADQWNDRVTNELERRFTKIERRPVLTDLSSNQASGRLKTSRTIGAWCWLPCDARRVMKAMT